MTKRRTPAGRSGSSFSDDSATVGCERTRSWSTRVTANDSRSSVGSTGGLVTAGVGSADGDGSRLIEGSADGVGGPATGWLGEGGGTTLVCSSGWRPAKNKPPTNARDVAEIAAAHRSRCALALSLRPPVSTRRRDACRVRLVSARMRSARSWPTEPSDLAMNAAVIWVSVSVRSFIARPPARARGPGARRAAATWRCRRGFRERRRSGRPAALRDDAGQGSNAGRSSAG